MKKLFLLLFILHSPLSIVHCENISDVFTTMPDSIFPLLTERNRHDMVDFYNNHMEAKVRNRLNDYARLDTLTDTYLCLTLSKSSRAEMKLLETDDSTQVICLVQTVGQPVRDSRVCFYNTAWQRLYWLELPVPETAAFFAEAPDSVARTLDFAQRSIDDLRLVAVSVAPDEPVFTLAVATDLLAEEEKKVARRLVRPVRYRWTGSDFVRE